MLKRRDVVTHTVTAMKIADMPNEISSTTKNTITLWLIRLRYETKQITVKSLKYVVHLILVLDFYYVFCPHLIICFYIDFFTLCFVCFSIGQTFTFHGTQRTTLGFRTCDSLPIWYGSQISSSTTGREYLKPFALFCPLAPSCPCILFSPT